MDFVVGKIPAAGGPSEKSRTDRGQIEARVVGLRGPRQRRDGRDSSAGEGRTGGEPHADPPGAKVLLLMVPEAYRLPDDLTTGSYRVFLRFARSK